MNPFTTDYGAIPDRPIALVEAEIKMQQLQGQIAFLIESFTDRDIRQRDQIEHFKNIIQQQALMITWFKALSSEGQPGAAGPGIVQ